MQRKKHQSLEHGRDVVSLEHDVRHALAARLEDRQVQTAETSTLAPAGKP